uniref:Uncharacterized protein n=1 Tax=Pristhesancus plagipennis TaxID=1955184 RepID=A0A2K8JMU3_PRIPG|nr:secreted hypothetical protein [Pristhesancus plagipennis]
MKYLVCVLLFIGAAVAAPQWGAEDDGQWRDDTSQYNAGDMSGQYNPAADQSGQWNPAADGSLAGQYNPALNNWVAPAVPQWGVPAVPQWGVPAVPQDTPEVAAAKAAHMAAHAAVANRWKRSAAVIAATPLAATHLITPHIAPLAAHSLLGAHTIVAPHFTTTVW